MLHGALPLELALAPASRSEVAGEWALEGDFAIPVSRCEQDVLDFVQRALHNREPFRAYSNFAFVADDGSINEFDFLIVPAIASSSLT